MLRSMSMHNFINFINPQRLTFDDGINFIIGGNSSGKTAIFELIRRSLSSTLNTSASSIPYKDKMAYTICHFVTPTKQMPSWEINESISSAPKDVIVCLFVPPVSSEDKPNQSVQSDDKANFSPSEDNGKPSPNEDKVNYSRSEDKGNSSSSEDKGNSSPSQDKGNSSPSQDKGNSSPSNHTPNSSPNEDKGNVSPSKEIGNSSPNEDIRNSSPNEDIGNSSPSEDIGSSSPSEDIGNSSPSEDKGNYSPSEDIRNSSPSEDIGNSSPSADKGNSSSSEDKGNSSSSEDKGNSSPSEDIRNSSPSEDKGNSSPSQDKENSSPSNDTGKSSPNEDKGNSLPSEEKENSSPSEDIGNSSPNEDKGNSLPSGDIGNSSQSEEKGNFSSSEDKGNSPSSEDKGNSSPCEDIGHLYSTSDDETNSSFANDNKASPSSSSDDKANSFSPNENIANLFSPGDDRANSSLPRDDKANSFLPYEYKAIPLILLFLSCFVVFTGVSNCFCLLVPFYPFLLFNVEFSRSLFFVSFIFYMFPPYPRENTLCYKMFIAITSNTPTKYKIFFQQIRGSAKKSFMLDSNYETNRFVENMLANKQDSVTICREVNVFFRGINQLKSVDSFENESINLMFNWVSGAYVGILPIRSIGPLQWTRSKLVNPLHKEENYQRACSQAEILMELLDENNRTKIDWVTAKKYRTHLVHPYEFRKDGNRIVVYNRDSKNTSQLLKIPDGVVEAEQLILLLSEKRNLTLTLEEPDRGMHPQMINRLRDLVLKRVVGKTVLVVSHHPSILDHFTLYRTYICTSTKSNEGKICHDVIKFPEGYTRYGMVDEMKASLFSKRVLFVEGYTDQIIVEAVFDVIINENNNEDKKIEVHKDLEFIHRETYKEFVSSLQVIDLKGCGNGKKGMEFCGKIKRESYVVYDFDVIGKGINCSGADKVNIVVEYQKANPNNFVWTGKDLEDVIDDISSELVNSDIKKNLSIPINNQKASWKAKLHQKRESDIKYLARILIKHSQEFQRFLVFLKDSIPE